MCDPRPGGDVVTQSEVATHTNGHCRVFAVGLLPDLQIIEMWVGEHLERYYGDDTVL